MVLTARKTKELLIHFGREELYVPHININGEEIERVTCAMLLGCHLFANLCIITTLTHYRQLTYYLQRLHLLRELKKAGVSTKDLLTCTLQCAL